MAVPWRRYRGFPSASSPAGPNVPRSPHQLRSYRPDPAYEEDADPNAAVSSVPVVAHVPSAAFRAAAVATAYDVASSWASVLVPDTHPLAPTG
ncbi:hypothetical protein J0H58_06585 [bacterium]|nr:hypothetical protein [bacterium]